MDEQKRRARKAAAYTVRKALWAAVAALSRALIGSC